MWWSRIIVFLFACTFLEACGPPPIRRQWTPIGPGLNYDINSIEFINSDSSIWITGGENDELGYIANASIQNTTWRVEVIANEPFYDLFVLDDQNFYLGGQNGLFARSTDGGINWDLGRIDSSRNINALFFFDELRGYAATGDEYDFGQLFETRDGGQNWELIFESDRTFRDIFFPDPSVGYLASYGFIFKTTNAGLSWEPTSAGGENFTGLYFFSADTGHACGGQGSIRYTFDGGENWRVTYPKSKPFAARRILNDIEFLTREIGYACGDRGDLFRSVDGGRTWAVVTRISDTWFTSLSVLRRDDVLVGDRDGNLFLVSP